MKLRPGEKLILPLWFRTGIVVTVLATLFISLTHRLADTKADKPSIAMHGQAVESQSLHFVDLSGGQISVVDADNNREITRLLSGEDGFMRSVMRGLVRERKAHGLGPEIPFELTLWEDGLVSLIDPATERRIEISAFGKDNVAAFTRLLPRAVRQVGAQNSSS